MAARRFAALLSAALLVVAVAGCGFQLRGSASLPPEMTTTWLQVQDRSSPFVRELELLLRANGVTLADGPGADIAELRIRRERISRRALSIAGDARVREFELVFDLEFELKGPGGEPLLRPETLRLERDFQFDEQEILGAANEEELLREDLSRSMAQTLIRRLEAFARR
jgi:LPS-assembly lipoprotein